MQKPDIMVVPDAQANAGAITWWKIKSATNYDDLRTAWELAGFPANELPAPPSDSSALRRALEPLRTDAHTLIRSVPGRDAFALVDEYVDDDTGELEYDVRFSLWIDYEANCLEFDREVTDELADGIIERFEAERRTLHHSELSSWLVKRAYAHSVVALRETGGVYFVPNTDRWTKFAGVVESAGVGTVYLVPAMRTEKAVEAIMAAVISDAGAEVEKLEKALEDIDTMGTRSLKARARAVAEVGEKLRLYEDLLGRQVGDLAARLQQIDARVVEATLTA